MKRFRFPAIFFKTNTSYTRTELIPLVVNGILCRDEVVTDVVAIEELLKNGWVSHVFLNKWYYSS